MSSIILQIVRYPGKGDRMSGNQVFAWSPWTIRPAQAQNTVGPEVSPKGNVMPPKPQTWTFGYEDLMELTGKKANALHQDRRRELFEPNDLASIVCYLARHGTPDLRKRMIHAALDMEFDKPAARRPRTKKAARKAAKKKGS